MLSFAGRLQLIKAVLFGVLNFWCRQVILPKAVIKKVNQLCARFFWKDKDIPATGARVSWKSICSPKAEGGLGVKNLCSWNHACIIHLVKSLLANESSLWAAWVKVYIFKGVDFWHIDNKPHFSWCIRKLLKLRGVAQPLFADGSNGALLKVKDIWDSIRERQAKVIWHRLIWYSLHVPRHSIILWMTLLDRLPTKDRLLRMGIVVEETCLNCGVMHETRDHLFFFSVAFLKASGNLSCTFVQLPGIV
ncbi:hypothetical protein GQ457_02G032180 [Hibiscus cannabinus]